MSSEDVVVTHLGTWDRDGDGLDVDHTIGIWAVSGQKLKGSTDLSSGTVHPLESGFRWKELDTPITLSAHTTYRIGDFAASTGESVLSAGGYTMNPQFASIQGYLSVGNSFEYPTGGMAGMMILGPNFKFGPAAVPEPALIQLPLFLGMGGAGYWFRRRSRAARS